MASSPIYAGDFMDGIFREDITKVTDGDVTCYILHKGQPNESISCVQACGK